jgi:hypothetical protein
MEADMLQSSYPAASRASARSLADRVRKAISDRLTVPQELQSQVWARSAGPHVVLGMLDEEPFARVTPLGGDSYGLAFRASCALAGSRSEWEPLFLVDELPAVVEHALIAVDAVAA